MKRVGGQVVHKSSSKIRVDTPQGEIMCSLRGRFRGAGRSRSPVVVGDRVTISLVSGTEGVLEQILPRDTQLTRTTAAGRSVIVAANVERLLVVLSALDPAPRWPVADRILVAAHRQELEPAIAVNKWDLVSSDATAAAAIRSRLRLYEELGYATLITSARTGHGKAALIDWLRDRSTVLTGHSGVGKSTLLNTLDPSLALGTGRVSGRTGKGRHTTTAVTLYRMPFSGYVADTPGFREFALEGIAPAEIGRFFREFAEHLSHCRFRDCLHRIEPDCAVRRAVEQGTVSRGRYESYLKMLASFE